MIALASPDREGRSVGQQAMAALSISDLALRYGENDVLRGVSVTVPPGKVVALLGPSGSGKTTLLRAVAGLETPHRGTISIGETLFFDAKKKIDLPTETRGPGVVFQADAQWRDRSEVDNVGCGLRVRGGARDEGKARAEKALGQIGLAHHAERYPRELSGGRQQRVALARALIYEPPVILL